MTFDFVGACWCWLGGVFVSVLFIATHNGGVPLLGPRLDISSCVPREEVDRQKALNFA